MPERNNGQSLRGSRDNAACRTEGLCAPQRLSAAGRRVSEEGQGAKRKRTKQQGFVSSCRRKGWGAVGGARSTRLKEWREACGADESRVWHWVQTSRTATATRSRRAQGPGPRLPSVRRRRRVGGAAPADEDKNAGRAGCSGWCAAAADSLQTCEGAAVAGLAGWTRGRERHAPVGQAQWSGCAGHAPSWGDGLRGWRSPPAGAQQGLALDVVRSNPGAGLRGLEYIWGAREYREGDRE